MATSRNEPEFWNARHAEERPRWTLPMIRRAAEVFDALSPRTVVEYGFGTEPLAGHLTKCSWRGVDFSEYAVDKARENRLPAELGRCADANVADDEYVCGVALLPNLTEEERREFLERAKAAEHAVFVVKRGNGPFASAYAFGAYLRDFWPNVSVESIGVGYLAHASRDPASVTGPTLTVGCSTLKDYHGTLYTIASLQTHHGDFGGEVEYCVVDNHPDPSDAQTTKDVEDMRTIVEGEGARYVQWAEKQGTYPGKNQLKVEARGKWVLTVDSHVLLSPGAIERCLEVIHADPRSDDMFQFPCYFRSYHSGSAGRISAADHRHQDFIYRHWKGKKDKDGNHTPVYGWTGKAPVGGDPYPIACMITSAYLVRREAWFSGKGYEPILGNYGGWEGPLQLKWWLMGRRVLAMRHKEPRDPALHHWHLFNHFDRLKNATGGSVKRPEGNFRIHTSRAKQRNFAASSAVIGGEEWVKRHCELKGWGFGQANIQEGMREGLKLRPWMVDNLATPAWEDVTKFFEWMRGEEIPGALRKW